MISWSQVSLRVLELSFCYAFTLWFLLRRRSHFFWDFLYLQLKLHFFFSLSGVCAFFLVVEPCDTQQGHINLVCYVSGPSILNTRNLWSTFRSRFSCDRPKVSMNATQVHCTRSMTERSIMVAADYNYIYRVKSPSATMNTRRIISADRVR